MNYEKSTNNIDNTDTVLDSKVFENAKGKLENFFDKAMAEVDESKKVDLENYKTMSISNVESLRLFFDDYKDSFDKYQEVSLKSNQVPEKLDDGEFKEKLAEIFSKAKDYVNKIKSSE